MKKFALSVILSLWPFLAFSAEELVVKAQETSDLKAVSATVDSVHRTMARTRIGGTVDGLSVDEGSKVEKGQVLAVVVDPKQPLAIEALDARIKSLEHEKHLADIEYKRSSALVRTGAVSTAALDKATAGMRVLENAIKSARAERDSAITHKTEGQVLAPLAGMVLNVPVTNGSVVMPGDSIAEIAVSGYILRLEVPERHARYLTQGQEVSVQEQEGRPLVIGTVQQLYPKLEQGHVIADVAVENLENRYVGERLTAYIPTAKRLAFYVPEGFVHKRYGVSYVTLKDSTEVVVQTGLISEGRVEILSGVKEGDILVHP